MRPVIQSLRAAVATLTLAGLSAGCGNGGSGGTSPTSPSPPSSTAVTIAIVGERGNQSFTPNPATASRGQMVAWRNDDAVVHRIRFNDGSLDTTDIPPGATSAPRQLTADGANYHCTLHPAMVGAISVPGGAPPACEGPYC